MLPWFLELTRPAGATTRCLIVYSVVSVGLLPANPHFLSLSASLQCTNSYHEGHLSAGLTHSLTHLGTDPDTRVNLALWRMCMMLYARIVFSRAHRSLSHDVPSRVALS